MKSIVFLLLLIFYNPMENHAWAQLVSDPPRIREAVKIENAYIDKNRNAHFVLKSGNDVQVTQGGRSEDLKIDKVNHVVGWLERIDVVDEKGNVLEESRTGIVVYPNFQYKRGFTMEKTIWQWKFWDNGRQVALRIGLTRSDSNFALYDLDSGREVEKCNEKDPSQCQNWAEDL